MLAYGSKMGSPLAPPSSSHLFYVLSFVPSPHLNLSILHPALLPAGCAACALHARAHPDGSGGFDVENIMLRRSVGVSSLCQGPILLLYSHLYRLQSYQIVLLCNCNLIPHCRLTKPYACRRHSPVDRALGLVLLAPRRGNGFPPPGDCRSPLPPSSSFPPSATPNRSSCAAHVRLPQFCTKVWLGRYRMFQTHQLNH